MLNRVFTWFENLIPSYPDKDLGTPPTSLVGFIWHYTKPVWPAVVVMSLFSAVIAVLQVYIFSFFGELVNWLSESDPSTFFADNGGRLIFMSVLMMIVVPAIHLLGELMMHQVLAGNFPMSIRWRGHKYLLRQSMRFYQNDFAGRIATKLMQTSLSVREVVLKVFDIFVFVGVYFFAAVVAVFSSDWRLALPFLGWLVVYMCILGYFMPRLGKISKRQADARSVMTGVVVDSYTNIQTVKLFSHAEREEGYVKKSFNKFLDTVHDQMRRVTLLNMSLEMANSGLLFATAGVGIYYWTTGHVSIGDIALSIALILRLQGMSHWVMWEMAGLFENIGTVQDGSTTLSRKQDVLDVPDAANLNVSGGHIHFNQARFQYAENKSVLEGLNLEIKPGEKIGLVGPSGAGKSTLVNLMMRFYDLESGKITIDGQDVSQVAQDSLRGQIGMVSQDTSLLHRSIRENIAYGRPDASEEEIIRAAERAKAWSFIPELEDIKGRKGLDALVGERGVNLSGGQRQRIAIARAFLKDAPILVLDEATSALDSEVEAAIQEQLYALMEGKTVIAIAHRLSTIAAMDRLVVLHEGEIIEQGTHDELVAAGGRYAGLWERQSGGFLYGQPKPAAAE